MKTHTDITIILDCSGSMSQIKKALKPLSGMLLKLYQGNLRQ